LFSFSQQRAKTILITFFTDLRIFSLILGKSNTFFFTFGITMAENIDKFFKKQPNLLTISLL